MISRYEATLNGTALGSISPLILVVNVGYMEPDRRFQTITTAKRIGARVTGLEKEKASVLVQFMIRAYDTRERQRICQDVCSWAKDGGELMINDRDGQKLICVCEKLPSVQSVRNWLDPLEIVFSAFSVPYWQDITETTATLENDAPTTDSTTASGTIYVPGNAPETLVSATITAHAALTAISVGIGDTLMSLHNISVAQDGVIQIGYDSDMILSIKYGTTSLLSKRFGADDLIAKCGRRNQIAFTADASCTVVYRARGWWE